MERRPLVEDIQNYAQNVVDTVREPLLIHDTTLRDRSANRAFYQTFHVSSDETEGRLIYELGNGQWDIPDLRTLLEDIVPKSSVLSRSSWARSHGGRDPRDLRTISPSWRSRPRSDRAWASRPPNPSMVHVPLPQRQILRDEDVWESLISASPSVPGVTLPV